MSTYRGKPLESYSKSELIGIVEEQAEVSRNAHKEFQKDLKRAYEMARPSPNAIGIGWILTVWGFVVIAIFCFQAASYRYSHETLTETQLTIWSLQHWIQWVPGAILVIAGLLMANWKGSRKP